ncbi:HRDC domain-containing protein [Bacillus marinisedimentorum]|uniref:HRDC domain-containing protein n=1 Tax=Bacillus marinisedimentorum TaxID=1821260 RepID=UPI0007E02ACA|nr:HRDC domain-containing protein [Bacillus marinisedimentorum]
MSILKNVFDILTQKREITEPEIYKEFKETSTIISNLTRLSESSDENIDQKKIGDHLKLFSIGHTGEKNVLFELQHSMLPLLILHDVYLEFEDYKAQLDFVIITHKFVLVLEVKKLFGNVNVTENGEFQRVITKNNRVVNKEGMYSPINQVERHVAILEKLLITNGAINKCPIKYAVTFANPKTILNISNKAPAIIKSNVIRHDQIKSFIKSELDKQSPVFMKDQHLYEIADTILQNSKEKEFNSDDYVLSTKQTTKSEIVSPAPTARTETENPKDKLKPLLMEFRSERSKELGVKPYYIFTNKMLDSLLEKKPHTLEEFLKIEGFGNKKAEEFGSDIITIIQTGSAAKPLQKNRASMQTTTGNPENLRLMLTEFRTNYSKKSNVKPFYVFTNKTLEAILEKKPGTIKELLEIEGIGKKKAEEFGKEILEIIQNER